MTVFSMVFERLGEGPKPAYHGKQPFSGSSVVPVEGCVDEIANERMSKKQRMRWSPRAPPRVALDRAAVPDVRRQSCDCVMTPKRSGQLSLPSLAA
jgi:hypothetical protein